MLTSEERTYRAVIDGSAFEVRVCGSQVSIDGFDAEVSLVRSRTHDFSLLVDGRSYDLAIEDLEDRTVRVTRGGARTEVQVLDRSAMLIERFGIDRGRGRHEHEVRAPMPGLVVSVLAEPGHRIESGQGIVVLEAMKMENQLVAPSASFIRTVHVKPGDAVSKNDLLVSLDPIVE